MTKMTNHKMDQSKIKNLTTNNNKPKQENLSFDYSTQKMHKILKL